MNIYIFFHIYYQKFTKLNYFNVKSSLIVTGDLFDMWSIEAPAVANGMNGNENHPRHKRKCEIVNFGLGIPIQGAVRLLLQTVLNVAGIRWKTG